MAKEAIEAVKEAEAEANAILEKAIQCSKNLRQEAQVLAEKNYIEIMKLADDEVRKIREGALLEGEKISVPIIEEGIRESTRLIEMTDCDLDLAVNTIIEKVVNTNGNS